MGRKEAISTYEHELAVTDGRMLVAIFGTEALDLEGGMTQTWSVLVENCSDFQVSLRQFMQMTVRLPFPAEE